MSSNDKAKEKLMESMRMTKASPGKKIKEADKWQNITPKDDKIVMPKKKVASKKKTAATKKASTETQKLAVDPYQSARRVWPD